MSDRTRHSIAMITAWMTSSRELMDVAAPAALTIDRLRVSSGRPNETIIGVIHDYDALRAVATELSLLCATAMTCWANSIGINPEDVLRDIAISTLEQSADTPD